MTPNLKDLEAVMSRVVSADTDEEKNDHFIHAYSMLWEMIGAEDGDQPVPLRAYRDAVFWKASSFAGRINTGKATDLECAFMHDYLLLGFAWYGEEVSR